MKEKKHSRQGIHFRYNIGVLMVILLVFLLTTLLQGYFTWKSINDELQNRKRMEANVENERVDVLQHNVEHAINSAMAGFEQSIEDPEAVTQLLIKLIKNNPEILGSAVAFKPDFLPEQNRLYAPYVYRDHGEIRSILLSYDYTIYDWYLNVVKKNEGGWCEPYADQDGTYAIMSTYSVPLRNKDNRIVAVLTADLPMSELSRVTNEIYHQTSMRSIVILAMQVFSILLIIFIAWRAVMGMRNLEQVRKEKERTTYELGTASRIQSAILPKTLLQHEHIGIHAMLEPAEEVSGDFYDYVLDGDQLSFCIGDVATRGLGAAMAMLVTRTAYRTSIRSQHSVAKVVAEMNSALVGINEQQMYATFFAAQLNLTTGVLHYCNAGHLAPVLLSANGQSTALPTVPNVPLGISEWEFEEQQLQLQSGDTLFLYTDGIVESMNQNKEAFGEKKLMLHLKNSAMSKDSSQAVVSRISTAIHHHLGAENRAVDDLTMLAVQFL